MKRAASRVGRRFASAAVTRAQMIDLTTAYELGERLERHCAGAGRHHHGRTMNKRNRFPPGWNEARVNRVLEHYESQSDIEAVAEDEAAYRSTTTAVMKIPVKLVPAVRALLQTLSAKTFGSRLRRLGRAR
jgi:hypothetical protein